MDKNRNVRKCQGSKKIKIPKKSFRLCRHDEHGTFSWSEGRMLRTTPLYRELDARVHLRLALAEHRELESRGMLGWEAYGERRASIDAALGAVREAAARYKERRLEAGLFYLVPLAAGSAGMQIRTHLHRVPLREALRRRRREVEERRRVLEAWKSSRRDDESDVSGDNAMVVRSCTKRLLLCTLSSVVLACAIIFL